MWTQRLFWRHAGRFGDGANSTDIHAMISGEGEEIPFYKMLKADSQIHQKIWEVFLIARVGMMNVDIPLPASQKRSSIGILQGRYQHPSIGLIGFDRDLTGTS